MPSNRPTYADRSPLDGVAARIAAPESPVWPIISPELAPDQWKHPYDLDVAALNVWYRIRQRSRVPFRIRSDYRSEGDNIRAGGARGSSHMQRPCRAVDLHVKNNEERGRLILAAVALGVRRIGIYPAAPDHSGSVHLDLSTSHPSPRIWTRY